MSLELNKDQLKGLIDFAKNEVLDDERRSTALTQDLNILVNNDMNLHRVMMMSLTHAGQINIAPPLNAYPMGTVAQDISLLFKANDPFTNEVFGKLHHQATYFACFANAGTEYPNLVVEEARKLLTVGTKEALFNELDLRFANIDILMELLDQEKVNYGEGYFTLVAEKAMNGNQAYPKTTLNFFHPTYTGNVYRIEKSVYQYNFEYIHLSKSYTNSISFSNSDGNKVIDLPDGLLVFLDYAIRALYKQYSDKFLTALGHDMAQMYKENDIYFMSPKQMVADKVENIGVSLNEIVTTCMSKFKEEDNLTYPEKMQAVQYFIREHLQYTRKLTIRGHHVAEMSQYDINVSEDNELIIFGTQIHTFGLAENISEPVNLNGVVGRTYEKKKLRFEFNHLGVSNVNEELENEDDNVLLFNLWVLNAFDKDFRSILHSAQHLDVLRKFGRTY